MKGFLVGFITASIVWGAAVGVHAIGWLDGLFGTSDGSEASAATDTEAAIADGGTAGVKRGRRRRRGRRRARRREPRRARPVVPTKGSGPYTETGDDIDENDRRELDLEGSGGEEQLSSAEIDAAFGRAMPGIRRCLLLLSEGQEGAGRVTFAVRIAGSGRVSQVRLAGPRALTAGEVGGCLRRTARAIQFPSFDGPDMVARYPITFE